MIHKIQMGKKELKDINEKIEKSFGMRDFIDKDANASIMDEDYIVLDNDLAFFYKDGKLMPSLKLLIKKNFLKSISVDKGAIKFVSAGADVMRPGIVEIDSRIKKGDIVAVVDSVYKVPLAIGEALFDAAEMSSMKNGKAVKNIHHVGDDIWKIMS